MSTSEILSLIEKYLKKNISEDELTTLEKLLENDENAEIFKSVVKNDYQLKTKNANFNAKESYTNIKPRLELGESKKVFKLKSFYKYAVAASVLLVLTLTVFFNVQNHGDEPQLVDPIIVKTSIQPGTDKATLTMGDGSVVTLEKGNTYQTASAKSNGEQLVYEAKNTKSKDIVYNYLTIPRGGQFFIRLSDGTEVWLNSESQLKYPVSFIDGETRQVELVYGEAYFDVSPSSQHNGADFKVYNNYQEIYVLGTEFNIKAYKDETNIYTTLVEGKVVIGNGISKFDLVPNQQSNLNIENNNLTIAEVDVNAEISWKNGIFNFKGIQLKAIMKVLSRWYDVDIVFENKELESLEFIGSLDKKQNIEEILSIMKSSTINNYELKNKIIILK